jgi:hypothetical protein
VFDLSVVEAGIIGVVFAASEIVPTPALRIIVAGCHAFVLFRTEGVDVGAGVKRFPLLYAVKFEGYTGLTGTLVVTVDEALYTTHNPDECAPVGATFDELRLGIGNGGLSDFGGWLLESVFTLGEGVRSGDVPVTSIETSELDGTPLKPVVPTALDTAEDTSSAGSTNLAPMISGATVPGITSFLV